jgi:hypothetical protein
VVFSDYTAIVKKLSNEPPRPTAIPNSQKMTVQPKNGQRYGLVMQYKTVPAAIWPFFTLKNP